MVKKIMILLMLAVSNIAYGLTPAGINVTTDLKIGAVIHSEEKGEIEALWYKGGEDQTARGDKVVWGFFYANPQEVSWGNINNPEVYVKIWFDASGRVDVNFFHVSVPSIEVYSDYTLDNKYDLVSTTTLENRYVRQYYEKDVAKADQQKEDGIAKAGYSQKNSPIGYYSINGAKLGAIIKTEEKGIIEALWHNGGSDITQRGDQVVWGFFYANPKDVSWGSQNNPEVFVKLWFDANGMVYMNYFHVSAPDIEVYSDFPTDRVYDEYGTAIQSDRYIRHDFTNTPAGKLLVTGLTFKCYKPYSLLDVYEPSFSFNLKNTLDKTISKFDMHLILLTPHTEVPWAEGDGTYSIAGGLVSGQTKAFGLAPNVYSDFGKSAKSNVCDDLSLRNNINSLQFVMFLTDVYDANSKAIE
jgi:hypothetical protein